MRNTHGSMRNMSRKTEKCKKCEKHIVGPGIQRKTEKCGK